MLQIIRGSPPSATATAPRRSMTARPLHRVGEQHDTATVKSKPPRRHPKPDRRRTLELLATSPQEGCSEAIMLTRGFTVDQLVELVRDGLATATPQRVKVGAQAHGSRDAADYGCWVPSWSPPPLPPAPAGL
jgi:hypothetical protein